PCSMRVMRCARGCPCAPPRTRAARPPAPAPRPPDEPGTTRPPTGAVAAMPLPIVVARLVWRSSFLSLLLAAPVAEAHAQATHTDSIPGTLVKFEMVPIAGSGNIAPFLIGRTEVTWDMYDAYWLQQAPQEVAGGADAVARPTQPYGAPDYGW